MVPRVTGWAQTPAEYDHGKRLYRVQQCQKYNLMEKCEMASLSCLADSIICVEERGPEILQMSLPGTPIRAACHR